MEKQLTPMMKQYLDIKKQYPDYILFFRLGDFYEMFFEDATQVSSLLHIILTQRAGVDMCGFPFHSANNYIKRLLEYNKKIAICEQIKSEDNSSKLVNREVVQIITPSTIIDEALLDNKEENSYLLSINYVKNTLYLSYFDLLTNVIYSKYEEDDKNYWALKNILESINPKEILIDEDLYFINNDLRKILDGQKTLITKMPNYDYSSKEIVSKLKETLGVKSLAIFDLANYDKNLLVTLKILCSYVIKNIKTEFSSHIKFKEIKKKEILRLDESTIKSLELLKSPGVSLFDTLNSLVTSSAKRLLGSYIMQPSSDINEINNRLDWTQFYYNDQNELKRVRDELKSCSSFDRVVNRIKLNKGRYQDLTNLKRGLFAFLKISIAKAYKKLIDLDLNSIKNFANIINIAINEEAIGLYDKNNIILTGYNAQLDEYRSMQSNSNKVLENYLNSLKEETGLSNLKIGFNKIIGYYLELSKLNEAPIFFERKQTLVKAERYTTKELKEIEYKVLEAESLAITLEQKLIDDLLAKSLDKISDFLLISDFINQVDIYSNLALVAIRNNYVKPIIKEKNSNLTIKDGRHPCVESLLSANSFIANDIDMDEKTNFYLITGPNMAGKSTYLRGNALIIIMAHLGSFVPATYAQIPLTDSIFCRVGASDNISRGESTFMVEMLETSYILNNATKSSFVIMDEIGRGTSTKDGMSIAYAVINELSNIGCKTLFATHYHELTHIDRSNIVNKTLSVSQANRQIVFLRKLIDGVASSSFALHIAKLAGIKKSVLSDALDFQKNKLSSDYQLQEPSLFDVEVNIEAHENVEDYSDIINEIMNFDPSSSTPIQALLFIEYIKNKLS